MSVVASRAVLETGVNVYAASTAAARPAAAVPWWDRPAVRVYIACFALNVAAAQILGYQWRIGNADAITRTANAAYVLFSRDPHAAAVGFVWPILPSIVQLPLLPFMRLLGHPEATGYVVSAAAGAGVVAALFHLLGQLGVRGWVRLLWIASVQLHAHFWYLSASGVAEIPLMLVLVVLVLALIRPTNDTLRLIVAGAALAAGVLIRYEALAFMAAVPVMLVIEQWPLRPLRPSWSALEARVVAILAPAVYTFLLWLAMNSMIMGDPLYFQRSVFSLASAPDVARNVGPGHPLWQAMGSVPDTLEYSLRRLTQANLALPFVWLVAVASGIAWRDRRLLSLAVLAASIFVLTGFQVFSGTLPPLHRYWGYATPLAIILAAGCAQTIDRSGIRKGIVFRAIASVLLISAAAASAWQLGVADGGVDERRVSARLLGKIQEERELRVVDSNWIRQQDSHRLASALDFYSAQGPTVVDTETAFNAILEAQHPERLVISSDRDFAKILDAPERYARYIVLADPLLGGERDLVNHRYPSLFAQGAPWARLAAQVDGTIKPWRVYEVLAAPDAAAEAADSTTWTAATGTPDSSPLPSIAPTVMPSDGDAAASGPADNPVLMPPPNTFLPPLFADVPVRLAANADFGESAAVFALVDPVRVVGLAPVGCWSGPDATVREASSAVLFRTAPTGTEFEVYMVRGARAYAFDLSTANYCWIDVGSSDKAGSAPAATPHAERIGGSR
jgi:hypothetical protein